MNWTIHKISGSPLILPVKAGDRIYVVGSNGSGKSALIQQFVSSKIASKARRIVAHRPTGFRSEMPSSVFQDREQSEQAIRDSEYDYNSRWRDHQDMGHEKQSFALLDLKERESAQALRVRDRVRCGDIDGAEREARVLASPFGQINRLFQSANLPVSLELSEGGDIVAHHRDHSEVYGIARMSDGERNATIIAATVLTMDAETVLLIDEPDRHLHRSVIQPFFSALFLQRPDCVFIVSTHDIDLAAADPDARVLVVRSCRWSGKKVDAWDVEVLGANSGIPEDLRRTILGARQEVLFVEGTDTSLDLPLYSALFPGVSVNSIGSCLDVRYAVKGMRECEGSHHIQAFGLIDRDDRDDENVRALAGEGVYALDVCCAESLYYCSDAIEAVAARQAESFGCDVDGMVKEAKRSALIVLKKPDTAEQMAGRRCERKVRNAILSRAPSWNEIKQPQDVALSSCCIELYYKEEIGRYRGLANNDSYDMVISRYAIKHSSIFPKIAATLKCRNRKDYERMVVSRIHEEDEFASKMRSRIHELSEAIAGS